MIDIDLRDFQVILPARVRAGHMVRLAREPSGRNVLYFNNEFLLHAGFDLAGEVKIGYNPDTCLLLIYKVVATDNTSFKINKYNESSSSIAFGHDCLKEHEKGAVHYTIASDGKLLIKCKKGSL